MNIGIHITGIAGEGVEQAASERLHGILQRVNQCGKQISDALLWTTREHFQKRFPGSKHYDPDKVQETYSSNGQNPSGEIEVNVPGVSRAYHDLTIRPRLHDALTIPIRREAFGRKAEDFPNAFVLKKKDGRAFIAQRENGHLVFLFRLVRSAFQRQDRSIMPKDETFTENIVSRIRTYLDFAK